MIAGGSGFIGSALASDWLAQNAEVVVLTRSPRARKDGATEVEWNGTQLGEWIKYLDGAEAVINLTGKNINCRHTPENVRALTESRVNSVRVLALAMEHVTAPPPVWIQASAVGFYGIRDDKVLDENSLNGNSIQADICRQWESAFQSAKTPKTRKVMLRIGFVLGRDGGALPILARMTKLFLGGSAGNGQQYISWIHARDLTRMLCDSVKREEWTGTFNATAPNPAMNADFMLQLRRTLHRPWSPPAPAWAVKLGAWLMNSDPSLALDGCRVMPKRTMEAGFQFQFPQLGPALKDIYG